MLIVHPYNSNVASGHYVLQEFSAQNLLLKIERYPKVPQSIFMIFRGL